VYRLAFDKAFELFLQRRSRKDTEEIEGQCVIFILFPVHTLTIMTKGVGVISVFLDTMAKIGKTFRWRHWFVVMVVGSGFPIGPLAAQPSADALPRDRYLRAVPLPTPAKIAAIEPKAVPPSADTAALPKRSITLAEISAMATHNHPGVQQAKRQAGALRGAWIQAGLKSNPSFGYGAEDMTANHAGTQGLTFSQPITPKYKLDARQTAINREYQAAHQTYQIQCQKAVNDAMLTAYRIAFNYRTCRVLEELARISQEARHIGSELLQAGEIGRSAFLDIKIQSERTQIALKDAEIAYQTACRELAILLALPERELIEITDPVEVLPPELCESALLAEIRAASPERRQAYAEVEAAKARLKQQCAEAGIDYDTNARIAYNTETKQNEFSVGIAVPVRLFDRNQGNIQRAKSELAASYRNVERVERLIAQNYEKQWGKYRTARNRVVAYKEIILSEARESLDLVLAAYRRGESDSLELLDAQRTFSTVQIEYLDSMNALMESQILLQGALLSGGLNKPGTEDSAED
jgi:cobalt-zinc-cadmium efflux system outer membrane protein